MQKRNVILPAACFVALVWGCAPELEAADQASPRAERPATSPLTLVAGDVIGGQSHFIIRDSETGCQYISFYNGGTVARLASDGKPMCGGDAR